MPPRKPKALRAVEGQAGNRTKAELEKYANETKPRPICPDPPDFLGTTGLDLWNELAEDLEAMGTLYLIDRHILGLYRNAYERWREAEREIAAASAVKASKTFGNLMPNPWVAIRNRAVDDPRKFGADRISAAARTRISVEKPEADADDPTARAILMASKRRYWTLRRPLRAIIGSRGELPACRQRYLLR